MTSSGLSLPTAAADRSWIRRVGLIAGPVLAALTLWLLPAEYVLDGQQTAFLWSGRATLAMMVWMSVWWLSEAVDVTVTSLLPLAMFPLLQVGSIGQTAAPYAHRLVFLYMGGFFLALAMQHWGLGKRIALLTIRLVGTTPYRIVGGFMLTTAVFSAFVSNTATAVMMVAIASHLTQLSEDDQSVQSRSFATCLMLAIAYAASIGGMATVIGTPPNAFLTGFLNSGKIDPAFRASIDFRQWLMLGVPVTLILLPLTYIVLLTMYRLKGGSAVGSQSHLANELQRLGKVRFPEWVVLVVFVLTVALWMFRKTLAGWEWKTEGQVFQPLAMLSDESIVMATSFLLFVIPARGAVPPAEKPEESWSDGPAKPSDYFILEWPVARHLPWGILLLFGGGLTLAEAVEKNGVAEFLASQTVSLGGVPPWLLVLGVTTAVVFLTELTSNAATTASLIPILAAIAPSLGVHPYLLIFPATFAASCAFMLPVATPPNAIVFGSGKVTGAQMAKTGLVLNLVSIVVINLVTWFWLVPRLSIQ